MEIQPGKSGKYKLRDYAHTAGWPTANAEDAKVGQNQKGQMGLSRVSVLTGPAPSGGPAVTASGAGCQVGWQSPKASDCKSPGKSRDVHLKHQAEMAGYPTPKASLDGDSPETLRMVAEGRAENSLIRLAHQFALPDMTGWALNPRFSGWLMGYPKAWAAAGLRAVGKAKKKGK